MQNSNLDYDVIIVGAGLSGIGTAYHLQTNCPQIRFKIIEGRASIGGTWDLFKYPGIRSDSDMYTFGFSFNAWKNKKSISEGKAILDYMIETVEKFRLNEKIQLNSKLKKASWDSENAAWTLNIEQTDTKQTETNTCRFLFSCTGYYDYENPYRPHFPNEEVFNGPIIHPQHWDTSLDYTNKRILVIGSGATAITMVPEMAKKAKKVTMLQRSPTYIANLPSEDKIANFLKKILPANTAHKAIRRKNVLFSIAFYQLARKFPNFVKKILLGDIKKYLGDKYDERHYLPHYKPWDQRLCVVPDNDFFIAIKTDKAEIITDTIKTFNPTGIMTDSGKQIDADIIITATGLVLKIFGGVKIEVDGKELVNAETHIYRGAMMSGVPNFATAIGYTNASWTLKVDLVGNFVTRLLNYMDKKGYKICTPIFDEKQFQSQRLLDFDAGYILRGQGTLPKQGSKKPWKVYENYIKDFYLIKKGNLNDGFLKYQ
jgi:monooxygenase